jgi:hypothetical protein
MNIDIGAILITSFCAVWNYNIATLPVSAARTIYISCCTYLLRRRGQEEDPERQESISIGDACCLLLIPHWWLGILVPSAIAVNSYGLSSLIGIIIVVVSIGFPYGYWIFMGLFDFERVERFLHPVNRDGGDADVESVNFPESQSESEALRRSISWESRLILKKVVQAPSDHSPTIATPATPATPATITDLSFRSRHPKTDIIVYQKKNTNEEHSSPYITPVVVNSHCDAVSSHSPMSSIREEDETFTPVFPIAIPEHTDQHSSRGGSEVSQQDNECDGAGDNDGDNDEENQEYNKSKIKNEDDHGSISHSVVGEGEKREEEENDHAASTRAFCTICYEEYVVGDDIAWSKNDQCHHEFHKHCIIGWLERHDHCPICRNVY